MERKWEEAVAAVTARMCLTGEFLGTCLGELESEVERLQEKLDQANAYGQDILERQRADSATLERVGEWGKKLQEHGEKLNESEDPIDRATALAFIAVCVEIKAILEGGDDG